MAASVSAQTTVISNANDSIDIASITYKNDNTTVVGTWYRAGQSSVTFNADGTTDWGTGYTYKFIPIHGRLTIYNASTAPVATLTVDDITEAYLLVVDYATQQYTYYTKSAMQVTEITLNESSLSVTTGQSVQLTSSVSPVGAYEKVTWSSSDESVATVDENGLVTAISRGNCTITAAAIDGSGVTASCSLDVIQLVTGITLNESALSIILEGTAQLTPTLSPDDASNTNVIWSSSDESIATVSSSGVVTGQQAGTATITCTAADGSGFTATCDVTVIGIESLVYVDLGLPSGTLWGACNLGAESPEEYGNYYAWGETSEKTEYNWGTYALCQGSYNTLTKYCPMSNYGYSAFTDDLAELELTDDAAYVGRNINWYIPSNEQFEELINTNYTTTEWRTLKGVYGLIVRSIMEGYTDNFIFLPASGYYEDTSLSNVDSIGRYWSRVIYPSRPYEAYGLQFDSSSVSASHVERRSLGYSIRPVHITQ